MRELNYREIVELAKTDLAGAIIEAKINMDTHPGEGWEGLYVELVEVA